MILIASVARRIVEITPVQRARLGNLQALHQILLGWNELVGLARNSH